MLTPHSQIAKIGIPGSRTWLKLTKVAMITVPLKSILQAFFRDIRLYTCNLPTRFVGLNDSSDRDKLCWQSAASGKFSLNSKMRYGCWKPSLLVWKLIRVKLAYSGSLLTL